MLLSKVIQTLVNGEGIRQYRLYYIPGLGSLGTLPYSTSLVKLAAQTEERQVAKTMYETWVV